MRKRSWFLTISFLFAVGLWFASLASPAAAQPITFRFEGKYDPGLTPPPEYAIDIGTPVQGEFSYDLATVDTAVSDDVGFYAQAEPYQLEFQIGDSIFFETDHYGFNRYRVSIENDDSSVAPTRDVFHIDSVDSALAASFGIDDVHATILLQDLTAQAFESDALPSDLGSFDLDGLGPGWLFLTGLAYDQYVTVVFAYRFRIELIERLPGQELSVQTDIKPGSDVNIVNPSSRGVVPVAILGSEDFDVADIAVATLGFGMDNALPAHTVSGRQKDVNADGFPDLLWHFRIDETGIEFGDTEACLSGETFYGTPFSGCDTIRTVPDR